MSVEITPTTLPTSEELRQWIHPVQDPEMGHSIVDLGLIYKVEYSATEQNARVEMTLTTPACPAAGYIIQQVKDRILEHPAVKTAQVELVWEPKWDPKTMMDEDLKDELGIF